MRGLWVLTVGFATLLTIPNVTAHPPGSQPITASGSFELFPADETNSTNSSYHAYIANLGIPPGPGDTLRFSWSANAGLGPAIHFEIHSHTGPLNYTEYYSIPLAVRVDDSWTVPGSDPYMVLWQNPSLRTVNVTYTFQLLAPPPDLTVFIVFPVILGVIVLLLWAARHRPRRPNPSANREGNRPQDEGL